MPTVYVAMEAGVLVARGDGDGWTSLEGLGDPGDGDRFECLAADGRVPDRVFVGTFQTGLRRSADAGASWDRVGAAVVASDAVLSVAAGSPDPDVVYAGTEPSALYRSDDGGDTWTALPPLTDLATAEEWHFPPRPYTHHVRWLEVDPHEPERLYAAIEAGALLRSTDGGETWAERLPGSRYDTHQLATHPDAPGRVYAAAGDGYAESADGGASWFHPQDGLDHRYCWSVAPTPGDPDVVLLSSASGPRTAHSRPGESYVYRRSGEGPWERLDGRGLPMGEGVLRAVLAPGEGDAELFAANNRGVFHTTDAGGSWDRLPLDWPEGYAAQTVRGLAVV